MYRSVSSDSPALVVHIYRFNHYTFSQGSYMNCVLVTPVPQHEARWYKIFMFRRFETLTHSSRLFSPLSCQVTCVAGRVYTTSSDSIRVVSSPGLPCSTSGPDLTIRARCTS